MDDIRQRAADGGLRERSKARRRAAIVRAALTLFAERGYDATTIADIAAAADVAPRTVAMYFPCKQDIAMSTFSRAVDELTDALRSRRPGESVTEILGRWLRADEPGPGRELKELSLRMFAANPELNALRSARMAAATAEGAEIVAEETRAAPGSPGPRIAAAAAAAILIELTDMPPGAERDEAITVAMRFLEAAVATLGPAGAVIRRLIQPTRTSLVIGTGGWHPGGDRATPVPGRERASSICPSPTD